MSENLLDIRHLTVSFETRKGVIRAVNDVSLSVPRGKIVGIVGESGCGKSMTARAVMGLIKPPGRVTGGEIFFGGKNLLTLPEKEMRSLRGDGISMIFQEPMTSLNPVIRVGKQVQEMVRLHTGLSREEARLRTVKIFEAVGIPEAEKRFDAYPHELSGGLRQRVLIAMAMVNGPDLLIADEPTTALDVTVEAQILRLMKELCGAGTSILLISHNLGVIAQVCDYVYVMYSGQIVEQADTAALFSRPMHPYTRGLLGSVRSLREKADVLATIPGVVPNPLHLPEGCIFSLRCGKCAGKCRAERPELEDAEEGHGVRCHFPDKG